MGEREDEFGVAGAPPPQRPPAREPEIIEFSPVDEPPSVPPPPPAAAPPAAPPARWSPMAIASIVAAGVGFLFLAAAVGSGAFPLTGIALLCAVAAIVLGALGLRETDRAKPGAMAGRGLAVAGLVVGIVQLGLTFLLPLLVMLVCCLACGASSPRGGSGSGGGGGGGCGDCSCGACACPDCDCGDCGCGTCDCGCGDCGSCDCGCGDCGDCGCGDCGGCGCGCATTGAVVAASPRLVDVASRFLAHHPDAPAYEADVYRVRGVRLCIGCFTTYPVFLLAAAALPALLPLAPWWAWLAGGVALSLAQAVSALGLTTTRARKVAVKTLLGLGTAGILHGVLASPWSDPVQATALLAAVGLAMLSAIPRARRMRGACRHKAAA